MPRKSSITLEMRQDIIEALKSGEKQASIANRFNISQAQVSRVNRNYGSSEAVSRDETAGGLDAASPLLSGALGEKHREVREHLENVLKRDKAPVSSRVEKQREEDLLASLKVEDATTEKEPPLTLTRESAKVPWTSVLKIYKRVDIVQKAEEKDDEKTKEALSILAASIPPEEFTSSRLAEYLSALLQSLAVEDLFLAPLEDEEEEIPYV